MAAHDVAPVPAALRRGGSAALWYGLFGGAAAWFTSLCVTYFLVTPACSARTELVLHLVHGVGIAAGAGAAMMAGTIWRRGDGRWPDDGGGRRDRTRFLAATGALLSSLFTLVIAAQWLAAIVHDPCSPAPRLPDSPDAMMQSEPWGGASMALHQNGRCEIEDGDYPIMPPFRALLT